MNGPERVLDVLLIEDNAGFAGLVGALLREVGETRYRLHVAERLSEGLARASQGGIDVILLDLGLPDSKGIETFHKARASVRDVPIVVVTAMDDEDVALEAVWAGAQDFLVKGKFDGKMLAHILRYAIERENVRIKDDQRREAQLRDREISSLQRLAEHPSWTTEAKGISAAPSPVDRYSHLMEEALRRRQDREADIAVRDGLWAIASELAAQRAGPEVVVSLHDHVLRMKLEGKPPQRALAYLEAGRRMLIELMGDLAACYLEELKRRA